MSHPYVVGAAIADFEQAHRRAFLRDARALLGGPPNDLIPYHEVQRRFRPEGAVYRGVQAVPLDQVVGSVDRFEDFDRAFLPRRTSTKGRWTSIDRAHLEDRELPPVRLSKVGDVYFVEDGNHRVSVARGRGQRFIDAEVTEARVRAPLTPDMTAEDVLLQAEYADFLRRTDLDRLRPDHDVRPSGLGRYDEIWGHIEAHRRWLEEELERRPVGTREAVERWYDRIYLPIVTLARERGVCDHFPGSTPTDVYLWLMRRREELYERYRETGEPSRAVAAHVDAERARIGLRRRLARPLGATLARARRRRGG